MTDRSTQEQVVLDEFRTRLERLAGIAVHERPFLKALDVAGTFVAIGTTLLEAELGRGNAARYLRDLADSWDAAVGAPTEKPN